MKIPAGRVDAFVRRPDPAVFAVLFYGPDRGLVRERAEATVRAVVPDPDDPFRVGGHEGDALRADPSLLADDARSLSLMGGRRLIRVRAASDAATPACALLLDLPAVEATVVLEAGDLNPRSSLRRLFEGARRAAACPCYRESGEELTASLRRMLAERRLRPDDDALDHLARRLGADRGVTRQEIDKLALYMGVFGGGDGRAGDAPDDGSPVRLTLDDAREAVGDGGSVGLDDLAEAAGSGEPARLERVLERVLAEGTSPVAVVRVLANHAARLAALTAAAEADGVDAALERARPPVHFRAKPGLRLQLRLWTPESLTAARGDLLQAEIACKTSGVPATVARRAAFDLCRRAAERRPARR